MMRLAISNKQAEVEIESFRAILFDSITDKESENKTILLPTTFINSTTLLALANSSCQTIQ